MPELRILEHISARSARPYAQQDLIAIVHHREGVEGLDGRVPHVVHGLGERPAVVGVLPLLQVGDRDLDQLVIQLVDEVGHGLPRRLEHGRRRLVEPGRTDADGLLGGRARRDRGRERALHGVVRVRRRHQPVRYREVRDVRGQGPDDAHGRLHGVGPVERRLEPVDAAEGGGDPVAPAGVGAQRQRDQTGADGGPGPRRGPAGVVGGVVPIDGSAAPGVAAADVGPEFVHGELPDQDGARGLQSRQGPDGLLGRLEERAGRVVG